MNNVGVDTANLAAMPLEDLEALAGPVVAALNERKAQAAKEERLRKRKEYDAARRGKTVAVTLRFEDKESAQAIRGLVKQLKGAAKLNQRTVADEVAAAVKRLPAGQRKARTNPQNRNAKATPSKQGLSATATKDVGIVNNSKTELPTANGV